MKIAEIDSKYIDHLRNMNVLDKYEIIDKVNEIEYEDRKQTYREINHCFLDCPKMIEEYPDEIDREICCDDIMDTIEDVLVNYEKSLEDTSYDVDPEFNAENAKMDAIIENNKILIYIPRPDGTLEEKYIDKRILDGTLKF